MNEFNQKHAYDNFDKEFNRSGQRKNSLLSRVPRWLWGILAGAALVGIGTARNLSSRPETLPAAQPAENQAAIVIPTSDDTFSAQAAVHNIATGDEQADSDEFAAVMASKSGKSIVLPPESVYTLQDNSYSVSVEELPVSESGEAIIAESTDESSASQDANDSVVVWIDQTPFQVHFEKMAEVPAGNIKAAQTQPVIQIDGHSYALHMDSSEAEGESTDNPAFNLDEQPVRISVEDLETKSAAGGNWFVQVFNSLFGETEPTPQTITVEVTVIEEAEPTATAAAVSTELPTAEPESQPTEQPASLEEKTVSEGPIRLEPTIGVDISGLDAPQYFDDGTPMAEDETTAEIDISGLDAPQYFDDETEDEVLSETEVPVQLDTAPNGENVQITAVLRTIAPAAGSELPETGMAEDWNMPMLLAAAAALLLVIVLARRLRKKG